MSTLSNRIRRGNAADVQQRGVNVLITPEDSDSGFVRTETELNVVRLGGMDVVNGGPAPTPNNIDIDGLYPGWRITRFGDRFNDAIPRHVAIEYELSGNWTNAYLEVELQSYGNRFEDVEVTRARIHSSELRRDYDLSYKLSDGSSDGNFIETTGIYTVQIATTVLGRKIMTWCMHDTESWSEFKRIESQGEEDLLIPSYDLTLAPLYGGPVANVFALDNYEWASGGLYASTNFFYYTVRTTP
jgi:hypothetical protein